MRGVPLTIVVSLVVLLSWILSSFASSLLAPVSLGLGLGILFTAPIVSVPVASLLTRPLARFFVTHEAAKRAELVGQVCVVRTGKVTQSFGQAQLEGTGADLLLDVRNASESLHRGDRVLIVSYDEKAEAFEVEPMDEILGTRESK
jgi:hypothetical protein